MDKEKDVGVKITLETNTLIKRLQDLDNKLSKVKNTLGKIDNSTNIEKNIDLVDKATKSISRLTKSSESLKNVQVSFQKLVPAVNEFYKSLEKLNVSTNVVNLSKDMSTAINKLANSSKFLANNNVDFSKITNALISLTESLNVPKLASSAEAVKNLSSGLTRIINVSTKIQNFSPDKFHQIAETIKEFVEELGDYERLEKTSIALEKIANSASKISRLNIKQATNQLKDTDTTLKNINNNLKLPSLQALTSFARQFGTQAAEWVGSAAELAENINLLEVAYDTNRKSLHRLGAEFSSASGYAKSFVNGLSDLFGLDESVLTRQLGYYRQIGNALNIDAKYADLLAENLLKMQLDVSSLYNLSFERSGEVLQASMAGQTKPIRGSTGADITQGTLQVDLDRLGINRAVTDLSRAEKSILIYLSLERQLASSQKDLAKTINSTANQQKIFSEQTQRLSQALGKVLTPALNSVLYVANGVLMVITELINMFAELVGFEIPEYQGVADLSDYLDSAEESAVGTVKALNSLRGFDKLNNITTPTSSGGAGGTVGGVDQRLLDALSEYDLGLENLNNKATQVRDKIMGWLGFTKEVNDLTGEITWKFEKITGGTVLGALAVGGIIYKGVTSIVGGLEKLGLIKFTNLGGLAKVFKAIVEPLKILGAKEGVLYLLLELKEVFAGIFSKANLIAAAIIYIGSTLVDAYNNVESFRTKVNETFSTISNLATKVINIVKQISEKIKPLLDGIKSTIKFLLDWTYENIVYNFSVILDFINGVVSTISSLLEGDLGGAIDNLSNMFSNLVNDVSTLFTNLVPIVASALSGIIEFLLELPYKAYEIFGDFVNKIETKISETDWISVGKNIVKKICDGLLNFGFSITSFAVSLYKKIMEAVSNINWGNIGKKVSSSIGDGLRWVLSGGNPIGYYVSGKVLDTVAGVFGYADGGFPEDGWFRASKNELVGKWDDGSTVVASNKSITDGIRQATTNGMMDAFAMSGNKGQNVNVTIVAKDNGLLNAIKFEETQRDRQYGY